MYTDLLPWLKVQEKIPVYAAALSGSDVTQIDKIKQGIIVIGNESKGISEEIFSQVTVKVTIPRKGGAESLNAAVATGVILSHLT
jgi:TrmH family RNA methyltransferase